METVFLITHDGLPHCDDVACISLFNLYFKKKGIKVNLTRTRDERILESYKRFDNVIIFDIGGGDLDHHKDEIKDGRNYSSIGKVWAKYKKEFKKTFKIDECSWRNIDTKFIACIDKTDNIGEMNPFTYYFNAIRGLSDEGELSKESLETCIKFMEEAWTNILISERKRSKERREYEKLPVIQLLGMYFKYNDNPDVFINIGSNKDYISGYIWKTKDNTFSVRRARPDQNLLIPGLSKDEKPGVIFTHKNGFMGEITSLEYLANIILNG